MPSQITEVRQQIKAVAGTVFAPEIGTGWLLLDDKLHRSVGHDGIGRIGISPNSAQPWPRDQQVEAVEVLVQVYGPYELKVDANQTVDPAVVEDFAERFQRGIKAAGTASTSRSWYYNVIRVEFPDDPTGNKSRFEAVLQGYGQNPALVETTG